MTAYPLLANFTDFKKCIFEDVLHAWTTPANHFIEMTYLNFLALKSVILAGRWYKWEKDRAAYLK
jgi:hypothetical protein